MPHLNCGWAFLHGCTFVQQNLGSWSILKQICKSKFQFKLHLRWAQKKHYQQFCANLMQLLHHVSYFTVGCIQWSFTCFGTWEYMSMTRIPDMAVIWNCKTICVNERLQRRDLLSNNFKRICSARHLPSNFRTNFDHRKKFRTKWRTVHLCSKKIGTDRIWKNYFEGNLSTSRTSESGNCILKRC